MKKELTTVFEQLLLDQRRNYLNEFKRTEAGLDSLAEERESELEEHGQEEQIARLLARLDDRSLQAIREVDAALQRIFDGTYGVCQACRGAITPARLRSLPAARFCIDCAAKVPSKEPPLR